MKLKRIIATVLGIMCICVVGIFTACDTGENTALTASEIYDKSKASVGEITTYDKSGYEVALGTGFVIESDGRIVTNYHVIEDAYSAKIALNGNTYTVQTILAYDKDIDLAVLKISCNNLPKMELCTSGYSVGNTVYALGSSRGLTATFSQGIITYADREIEGVEYVQHDAAISGGNSGGPLINAYGQVVGINTMTVQESQNLNFAISSKEISNLTYGTPLTFAQFYEKECDVFTKIKNFIIQTGTYSATSDDYTKSFGWYYGDSISYKTGAIYYVDDNEIWLTIYVDASWDFMVSIIVDEIDGIYTWAYIDGSDWYMTGNIYGSLFHSDYTLTYNYYSGFSSSYVSSVRSLSSSAASILLLDFDSDYSSIGVCAQDLGFVNY